MTSVPYDPAITNHLQVAAELIALKGATEERVAWARFLLSELEPMMPKAAYTDLLTQLQELIAGRLADGAW